MTETSTTTNTAQADALRAAADFITEHPHLPNPYITSHSDSTGVQLHYYLHINGFGGLAEQKAAAAAIVRAAGGDWHKEPWGDDFRYTTTQGSVEIDVQVKREAVCERIVLGTEQVTVPAVESQPKRTETREVVEWRCEPLLSDEQVSA